MVKFGSYLLWPGRGGAEEEGGACKERLHSQLQGPSWGREVARWQSALGLPCKAMVRNGVKGEAFDKGALLKEVEEQKEQKELPAPARDCGLQRLRLRELPEIRCPHHTLREVLELLELDLCTSDSDQSVLAKNARLNGTV